MYLGTWLLLNMRKLEPSMPFWMLPTTQLQIMHFHSSQHVTICSISVFFGNKFWISKIQLQKEPSSPGPRNPFPAPPPAMTFWGTSASRNQESSSFWSFLFFVLFLSLKYCRFENKKTPRGSTWFFCVLIAPDECLLVFWRNHIKKARWCFSSVTHSRRIF